MNLIGIALVLLVGAAIFLGLTKDTNKGVKRVVEENNEEVDVQVVALRNFLISRSNSQVKELVNNLENANEELYQEIEQKDSLIITGSLLEKEFRGL